MGFPGFGSRRTVADEGREVVVERRADETLEEYEARRDAALRYTQANEHRSERRSYDDGRRDQARYDRGELHGRRRRGGFGFTGVIVVLIAAIGVLWLVLAAREGSFAAGGAVVDRKVAELTNPARVAVNDAADRTGAAVQNAGQALETQGDRLRERAQ